ncbi:MAG: hemolysin family protein [Prevotellaceae bacterium]|jgi:CBS domain containing-hemolysin-like protein|nr:hemolysin family protein [Prevotellaceae bacterium]
MNALIYTLITIAFSAFFSGMEIAFVSVDKLRFEMGRKDTITSRILSFFFRNSNNFISTMLVGNNVALVIYGILMAQLVKTHLLGDLIQSDFMEVLIQTIISTIIILVTGEFLPKNLFKINPNLMLKVFAFPAVICYVVLYPISKFASGLSYLFLRMGGMKLKKGASEQAFTKVDLDYFVQSGIDNADDREELDTEVKIFQNALDFSNIKIRDCIVPRTEVVAVGLDTTLEELKNRFVESGLSKIIVFDGNIDNVVGYIHSSEMFRTTDDWRKHVVQVPIVPETMAAHKLMKLFMQQKKTIAVVVDEFGGTSGIVSLEDLVEEIFGDIEDEHDNTSYICKQLDEREYILSARLEIEKVNETFGLELPESDEYLTVGGLILNRYQRFPKMYEVVAIDNFRFKIIKVTATKIELVRLSVVP